MVWPLWAMHVSHHHLRPAFPFFPLFSQHVGVESQHPRPLHLSLSCPLIFLVGIKEDDEREEEEDMRERFEGVQQAFV